jgi:hypothetical protein
MGVVLIYIRPDAYLSFHAQHFGDWSLTGCPEKKAKKMRWEGGRKEYERRGKK